jgi:hypothetical protein
VIRRAAALAAILCQVVTACGDEAAPSPAAATVPDPLAAARALLVLHDTLGRQPDERSDESKAREIDRPALAALVADLEDRDPFVSDLYVGFVVGALAQFQDRLVATVSGDHATIIAGRARIALRLDGGRWRFVLDESVPREIKERAAEEKRRYDEARARSGH